MSYYYKDIPIKASIVDHPYKGGPFDESYFNQGKGGGYSNYEGHFNIVKPSLTQTIVKCRADDIESYQLVNGLNIVVLGCGIGFLVNELSSRGADVVGIDISSYAINRSQALFPTLDFQVVDALNTGLKKNDYDLVIANQLIQCMPDGSTLDLLLEELYRIVNPSGWAYALNDDTPQYYFVIADSELIQKFENWFGSGVVVITDVGHLPLTADKRITVGAP